MNVNGKTKMEQLRKNNNLLSIFPFSLPVRGFSLIELLVAVSIFVVISTVILANHSRFNSSVLLGALAYDIALSVREAQVYGTSVREFGSSFQVGYGVRFSDASSYVFFVDTNMNYSYDDGVDSIIRTYAVGRGHTISYFCGTSSEGIEECSNTDGITNLDIVFFRPDPDAFITSNEPGIYSSGRIVVSSPAGDTRSITVASTGQISVQNP